MALPFKLPRAKKTGGSQPGTPRRPGHERRRGQDATVRLGRAAGNRAAGRPAHLSRPGVGCHVELPRRQLVQPDRSGARPAAGSCPAHAGAGPSRHGGVVETLRPSGAAPVFQLAFEFLLLTTARSGEVRGAERDEIETENHAWTVPVMRTKAKRKHGRRSRAWAVSCPLRSGRRSAAVVKEGGAPPPLKVSHVAGGVASLRGRPTGFRATPGP